MTDFEPPVDTSISAHAAAQALHEARELRRRQDDVLQARRRVVAGVFVLYLSSSAVAASALDELAPTTTGFLLLVGASMVVMVGPLIDYLGYVRWNHGPDPNVLLASLTRVGQAPKDVDLHLVECHERDYRENNLTLLWVTVTVYVVALVAFGTITFAIREHLASMTS